MPEIHDLNRLWWNDVTPVHLRSQFYDVPAVLAGRSALDDCEQSAFSTVNGKALLHLQCHFGLSSLSWARAGACVTGVDFSDVAIKAAERLAAQAGLAERCRFVCADVLDLDRTVPAASSELVFTSYGVITWLSDLRQWGRVIAHALKPGGEFFLAEVHPLALIFEARNDELQICWDYFHSPDGVVLVGDGQPDYADNSYIPPLATREWQWTVADVFTALTAAGLQVTGIEELPHSCFRQFPTLVETRPGMWQWPESRRRIPLTLVVRARKPG